MSDRTRFLIIASGISAFILFMVWGVSVARCIHLVSSMTEIEISTMRWRWSALSVYLLICFYDFMFVPIWYGLNRPDISAFMMIINNTEEVLIQLELMKKLTAQHNPFTLMGGGLFHLAFGAILTGSAVGLGKNK